jgi:hypothetical protein
MKGTTLKRYVEKLRKLHAAKETPRAGARGHAAPASLAMTLLALACTAAINVHADTIPVTSTDDAGADTLLPGTLRNALATATDGDTIDATGITGTITLMPGLTSSASPAQR